MSCGCDKPDIAFPKEALPKGCNNLPPVLEIKNEECPILFHTVEMPGTIDDTPAEIGLYRNVLVAYKGDGTKVMYDSDGIPSIMTGEATFDSLVGRPKYAGEYMNSDTNIPDVNEAVAVETTRATGAEEGLARDIETEFRAREDADTELQGNIDSVADDLSAETLARSDADSALQGQITTIDTAINRNVMTELEVSPTTSATAVQLDATKVNLKTSSAVTESITLPVASTTQAGVMSKATYDAVAQNTSDIDAMKNGSVAVAGISASATQADITTAWQTATGLTTLINGARVYDIDNNKVWTYYTNDSTWHEASNTTQVTVSTFTNSSEGIIKGSTVDGQVFAESDGTGSVNGWDTLSGQVGTNTSKLATIAQGAEVNVQSNWAETDTTSDAYIQNKPTIPTVNNATLTIQKNGTNVATFTANSASNVTANISGIPTITASTTDIGAGATLAAGTLYGVYI